MKNSNAHSGLYLEQMYTGCLAEAAYYIESDGEAVIIDPMRETSPYIEKAAERGATIKYVFETHFHADFVSGHVELARKTGAQIVYGPTATTNFDTLTAEDGQEFKVGKVRFKVLHTPGHTPESSCYLLFDESDQPHAVFTGDTLFIGEVGRPDLAIKSDLTEKDLAGMLYDSLRNQLMVLPDEVLVYPAHGAGSACGKNISSERFSTIGKQKQENYALQPMSKKKFVQVVTTGIMPAPQYFAKNAEINKSGYSDLDELLDKSTRPMSVEKVARAISKGALVLDTRKALEFGVGFIPSSIFIGLDGSFASWVGTLIEDLDQPLILVTEPGREREAILRLARVGYTNALGFVEGGVSAWESAGKILDTIESLVPETFAPIYHEKTPIVLDVRKPSEYELDHIVNADLYPLDYINNHLEDLDKDETYYIHCRSGFRSMVAASILRREGYPNLINIDKGFLGLSLTDIPRASMFATT